MPPSKTTIDNIPIDISTRYAEDQQRLSQPLIRDIRESSAQQRQTQIDVYSPAQSSFLEGLTGKITIQSTIASFTSPADGHGNIVFSYQLIPSLGPSEKMESATQKIHDQIEMKKAQRKDRINSISDQQQKRSMHWQYEQEDADEQDEGQKLTKAIALISSLNEDLIYTNGARKRYTQG